MLIVRKTCIVMPIMLINIQQPTFINNTPLMWWHKILIFDKKNRWIFYNRESPLTVSWSCMFTMLSIEMTNSVCKVNELPIHCSLSEANTCLSKSDHRLAFPNSLNQYWMKQNFALFFTIEQREVNFIRYATMIMLWRLRYF